MSGFHYYLCTFCRIVPEPCNETGAIRLTHGEVFFSSYHTSGRLEVCFGGQWGSVCYSDETTNGNIGKVVCRQLNQTAQSKNIYIYIYCSFFYINYECHV